MGDQRISLGSTFSTSTHQRIGADCWAASAHSLCSTMGRHTHRRRARASVLDSGTRKARDAAPQDLALAMAPGARAGCMRWSPNGQPLPGVTLYQSSGAGCRDGGPAVGTGFIHVIPSLNHQPISEQVLWYPPLIHVALGAAPWQRRGARLQTPVASSCMRCRRGRGAGSRQSTTARRCLLAHACIACSFVDCEARSFY